MTTETRDGFEIVTFEDEVIHFVPCSQNHPRSREKVLSGLLRNLRDDCFVRDTRDAQEGNDG